MRRSRRRQIMAAYGVGPGPHELDALREAEREFAAFCADEAEEPESEELLHEWLTDGKPGKRLAVPEVGAGPWEAAEGAEGADRRPWLSSVEVEALGAIASACSSSGTSSASGRPGPPTSTSLGATSTRSRPPSWRRPRGGRTRTGTGCSVKWSSPWASWGAARSCGSVAATMGPSGASGRPAFRWRPMTETPSARPGRRPASLRGDSISRTPTTTSAVGSYGRGAGRVSPRGEP